MSYYEIQKKIRRTWTRSPVEQVVPNKKKDKSRKTQKQEFKRFLEEEDYEGNDSGIE